MGSAVINSATTVISYIGTFLIGLVIGFFLLLNSYNVENIVMDIIPKKVKNSKTSSKNDIDEIKLFYLEQLIKECKKGKTKLFFTVSPFYFNDNDTLKYQPIKQLCTKYNIPFIKYDNTPFIENKDLFSDSSHLNDEGASEYSKYIVSIINAYL